MTALPYTTIPSPVTGSPEWHELRRTTGIGASEVAAALGMCKWTSPVELYLLKRGMVQPCEPTRAMELGTRMEPIILDLYEKETGLVGAKPESMFVSKEHPFLFANLDWFSEDRDLVTDGKRISYADEWQDNSSPLNYVFQIQAQMLVTGASKGHLYALHHNDTILREIEADAAIQATIIEGCKAFWESVQQGNAPDPQSGQEAMMLNSTVEEKVVAKLDNSYADLVAKHYQIKQQIELLETKSKAVEGRLAEAMGNAKSGKIEGWQGSLSRFVKKAHVRPACPVKASPQFRVIHPRTSKEI